MRRSRQVSGGSCATIPCSSLDFFALDDLESVIRDAVPPGLHRVVLEWGGRCREEGIAAFIEILEPHLRAQVPGFAAVARHALADLREHVRALEAPKAAKVDPGPAPGAEAASEPATRPWWRFW